MEKTAEQRLQDQLEALISNNPIGFSSFVAKLAEEEEVDETEDELDADTDDGVDKEAADEELDAEVERRETGQVVDAADMEKHAGIEQFDFNELMTSATTHFLRKCAEEGLDLPENTFFLEKCAVEVQQVQPIAPPKPSLARRAAGLVGAGALAGAGAYALHKTDGFRETRRAIGARLGADPGKRGIFGGGAAGAVKDRRKAELKDIKARAAGGRDFARRRQMVKQRRARHQAAKERIVRRYS